jgi:predicted GNAT family acetyltransferase
VVSTELIFSTKVFTSGFILVKSGASLYFQSMQIQLEQTESKGSFFIEEAGSRLAEMTFTKAGAGLIIIDHTEVSDALRGTGAGKKLVTEAVEYARKHKLKILPLCPFAKSVFDKTPEFADVLR